jgi:hypothetical protein
MNLSSAAYDHIFIEVHSKIDNNRHIQNCHSTPHNSIALARIKLDYDHSSTWYDKCLYNGIDLQTIDRFKSVQWKEQSTRCVFQMM